MLRIFYESYTECIFIKNQMLHKCAMLLFVRILQLGNTVNIIIQNLILSLRKFWNVSMKIIERIYLSTIYLLNYICVNTHLCVCVYVNGYKVVYLITVRLPNFMFCFHITFCSNFGQCPHDCSLIKKQCKLM